MSEVGRLAEEPLAEEPLVSEPVAGQPVASEPVAGEPAVSEPVAEEPVASAAGAPQLDGSHPFPGAAPETMRQMHFVDVVLVLPATHPVVVLQEADFPYREMRIPVGGAEGVAIGYAARSAATPRPLTHELVTRLLQAFGLTLEVVRLTGCRGGTFLAEIVVSGSAGTRVIDCRPSDAIALALRQPVAVPIVAAPELLEEAGAAPLGSN
jgi:bifunctional DNase/RNase